MSGEDSPAQEEMSSWADDERLDVLVKAAFTGNARTHGATARPRPEDVLTWLSIILEEPDLTLDALVPQDERSLRALDLARAEASLRVTEVALRRFEAGREPASEVLEVVHTLRDWFMERVESREMKRLDQRKAVRVLDLIERAEFDETGLDGKRHRLLKRYWREARARRRRALAAWLEVVNDEPWSERPDLPKQGQISP
jgi:hypothetical protein